ncbi:MAG: ATP-dependent DNA ligase, partial [Acidobacteria bacterium]|nr:ATP-dependent DNA ligase [Acidobacteriota bacterium]
MSLKKYRHKRRFDRTPEPPGSTLPSGIPGRAGRFVVQKHQARRLHWDFRLEVDGVLKSWAVPKGPSLNPADKRLAVMTEDHPLEYGDFEGNIPEGNYGAGSVMVWDQGVFAWGEATSPTEQFRRGNLKIVLQGEKLRGGFDLVQLKRSAKGNEWLLIKRKDAYADPAWEIAAHDGSVLTGRTQEEIAEQSAAAPPAAQLDPGRLAGAKKARMPKTLSPMLATLTSEAFSRPDWLFELKWDGVRALAWVRKGELLLRGRSGRLITAQYPELAGLPQQLSAETAILDGEIVVLDARGGSDFERLQERLGVERPGAALLRGAPAIYFVFDLLYLDGYDLRGVALEERKRLLRQVLVSQDPIRYCDHQVEQGRELFRMAAEARLEGIIGKHAASRYVSGRSPQWLKFKVTRELDAVVGGYTAPRGSREHFGALLLGLYAGKELCYIGSVGSGFTGKQQEQIIAQLRERETNRCPFAQAPETKEPATWVKPALVVRVRFATWTEERRLRQPVFLGLRRDANPSECRLESELPAPAPPQPPAVVARVLQTRQAIERELFGGRVENVMVEFDGRRLHLSNLNKLYFPEDGYRKRDLLAYYYRIADVLLPYLRNRPLVLRRYPDGIHGKSFFQKEVGEDAPEWMPTVEVFSQERGGLMRYFLVEDRASLLYLANL